MAAAGFRIRKVKTEQSIGDKLKRARIRRKISVAQVEEATKIRDKFILALESDSWELIPSEVYGRGYLERYAEFLQLPVEVIMKQYDRERTMYARSCKETQVELAPPARLRIPRFLLTPRFFVVVLVLVGLSGAGFELYKQIRLFTADPFIHLVAPAEAKESSPSELIVSTNTLTFTGQTAIGAALDVNGRAVAVNDDGSFTTTVEVHTGANELVFTATNKHGGSEPKITTERRTIIVK